MVAMRYAQTSKIFPIKQLVSAVPYGGNEGHKFFRPSCSIDGGCFINGPQAPYSDLIVAGVPKENVVPSTTSVLAKALMVQDGAGSLPIDPLLVQCKLTSTDVAECNFKGEYAKMGFLLSRMVSPIACHRQKKIRSKKTPKNTSSIGQGIWSHLWASGFSILGLSFFASYLLNPVYSPPYGKRDVRYWTPGLYPKAQSIWLQRGPSKKRFRPRLRRKHYKPKRRISRYVKPNSKSYVVTSVLFATNKTFKDRNDVVDGAAMMEGNGDCKYAWQKLYPIIQLVREEVKFRSVGREKCDPS